MARYYGTMQGSSGAVTKLGTMDSGLSASVNGWTIGASVNVHPALMCTDIDRVSVYLTSGSSGDSLNVYMGTYSREDIKKLDALSTQAVFNAIHALID